MERGVEGVDQVLEELDESDLVEFEERQTGGYLKERHRCGRCNAVDTTVMLDGLWCGKCKAEADAVCGHPLPDGWRKGGDGE